MQQSGNSRQEIVQNLLTEGYTQQQISDALNQASIKKGIEGNMANENQPSSEMQVSALDQEPAAPPTEQAAPAAEPSAEGDIPIPTPTPPPVQEAAPEVAPGAYTQVPSQAPAQQVPSGAYPQQVLPQGGIGGAYEDMQSLVEEIIDEKWREMLASLGDITAWKSHMADETEAIKQEILRIQSRFDNLQAAVLGKVDEYGTSVKDIGSEMKALEKVFEKILEPLTSNIKELGKITNGLRKHK